MNRRGWKICAAILAVGTLCIFIGEKGATVDSSGILHEVGPILPLGGVMLFIGIIGLVSLCLSHLYHAIVKKR